MSEQWHWRLARPLSAYTNRSCASPTKFLLPLHDRRVTVSATVFFAHFLRLARIIQLTLPNLGTCDVAVIHIPTVYELCTNKSLYAWPMCYEATLKYLRLLVAAGVFNKPKQKRGTGVVYHFPLIPVYGSQRKYATAPAQDRAEKNEGQPIKGISARLSVLHTARRSCPCQHNSRFFHEDAHYYRYYPTR